MIAEYAIGQTVAMDTTLAVEVNVNPSLKEPHLFNNDDVNHLKEVAAGWHLTK